MWLQWYGLEWTKIQLKQTENYYNDSYIWWRLLLFFYIQYIITTFSLPSRVPPTLLLVFISDMTNIISRVGLEGRPELLEYEINRASHYFYTCYTLHTQPLFIFYNLLLLYSIAILGIGYLLSNNRFKNIYL